MKKAILVFLAVSIGCLLAQTPDSADTTHAEPDTGIVLEFHQIQARVDSLIESQDWADAESLANEGIDFAKERWGEVDSFTAQAYHKVSEVFWFKGILGDAEKVLQKYNEIVKSVHGEESTEYAGGLNDLGQCYQNQGNYSKAEPLFERALSIKEKALGPDHPDVATSLGTIAELFYYQGNYSKAESLYERALSIREKTLGPDHPIVAQSLNNLAALYYNQGNYSKVEPLFERALSIQEKTLGSDHPDVATSLNNLADLYEKQGNYSKAEPLFERALSIREKAFGPDHPDVAAALNGLAGLYRSQGNYSKAEPLNERALSIREKAFGPDHPDVAKSLNDLALLYFKQGNYSKAEPLFERALSIDEKALGPDHPEAAISLGNLAVLYSKQGSYSKAEPLLERALSIREKALGPDHPIVAASLNNLVSLHIIQGNYSKAEPLYERALSIREKALGPDHPDVSNSLIGLAFLYHRQGNYSKAEPLYERALSILEKALGPDNPVVASSMTHLAKLYYAQGQYSKAETLFERALSINEKAFGLDHTDVATLLNNLVVIYYKQGNYSEAEPLYERANNIDAKTLESSVRYLNENRLLKFINMNIFIWKGHEIFFYNYLSEKPAITKSWLNHILTYKGASGRSASAMRAAVANSGDTNLVRISNEMAQKRGQIATLEAKEDTLLKNYIAELKEQADSLEEILTRESAEYRDFEAEFEVEWTDIQNALGEGEAAIEFTTAKDDKDSFWYYVALIVKPGIEYPEVVTLANTAIVDTSMTLYSMIASKSISGGNAATISRKLYEVLWQPLEIALSGVRRIYLCPEGNLYKVNFKILQDTTGTLVMDKYDIRLVNSTIDLTKPEYKYEAEDCFVIGGPDYDWTGIIAEIPADTGWQAELAQAETRSSRSADLHGLHFSLLPETLEEAKSVGKKLRKNGLKAKVITGEEATEEAVKSVNSPRILHIATHGFVLEDQEHDSLGKGQTEAPMMRTGIALTGANRIANDIEIPLGEEDGILTASEMMEMRLRGTDLVTLSACETGLGKAQTGEGVFGLRRALQLAGAKYVLLSLWTVPDEETSELMQLFYDNYLSGIEIHEALKQAQHQMREKVIDRYGEDLPYYWGAFVVVGR